MMAHHVGSSVMMKEKLGDAVGVVAVPAEDPAKPATMATMSGNVLLAGSRYKNEGFDFIAWLSEREPMDKWSRSRQGQLPVLKSVSSMPYYTENPFFKVSARSGYWRARCFRQSCWCCSCSIP